MVFSSSERRRPGWFSESHPTIIAAILDSNKAQLNSNRKCKPSDPKPLSKYEILRNSRKKFRLPVAAAENSWMANKITGLGQGIKIPKAYVESNLGLRQQYQTRAKWTQQVSFRTAFHKQKQNMCSDPVENARTVRDHFQRVCNIKNELDPEAL